VLFIMRGDADGLQKCLAITGRNENKYAILLLVIAFCITASDPKAQGAFPWFNCLNILAS